MDSFPAIVAAILVCSLLVLSAFGLGNIPAPPTAAQIAAAERHLDGVCVSCPVYEIVEADASGYPPLSRTIP